MGSEEIGLITGGHLFHNLKDSTIDLSKVFVIQRALVVRCNARKDLFLAFRVIQTHVGIGLKGSDVQGMTGSLIQKSDELLIDCVDLGTMLLDFLECLVLFRQLILLSRKDGKRTL